MSSNLNGSDFNEMAVDSVPQSVGDWGEMMLPISDEEEEAVSKDIGHVAYQLLVDVFDMSSNQSFSFDALGLKLQQIECKLEEMCKNVDKLLKEDLDTAMNRLRHALINLKLGKDFQLAYEDLQIVLNSAENAYPKVEEFNDKMLCKQLKIYSQIMTRLYDEETQTFVALSTLSETKKRNIAGNVFIDIRDILEDFRNIKISWAKSLLGMSSRENTKNQDSFDSLLKRCLPVIWNYLPVFSLADESDINKYVPEGVNDAAKVTLQLMAQVRVWKERDEEDNFTFQWLPYGLQRRSYQMALKSSFPIISDKSFFSGPSLSVSSITYSHNARIFSNLKECLEYDSDSKDTDDNEHNVIVTFSSMDDITQMHVFDEKTELKFSGDWYDDFIENLKSKNDFKNKVQTIPENVRINCKDRSEKLLIHWVLGLRKEWCEPEVIELILNRNNIFTEDDALKRTPQRWSYETGDMNIVKLVVEIGGLDEAQDRDGKFSAEK